MCFSPIADLAGSVVVGGIGVVVLGTVYRRRVADDHDDRAHHHRHRARHDHLAFAALPLLFAFHQFVETFVWWGLRGDVPHALGTAAIWIYLLFAFVLLPTYVPLAIRALEPPGRRRQVMTAFVALGAVVSATLLAAMIRGPVTAREEDLHIAYHVDLHAGVLIVGAYVIATCASAVFSGYRQIAIFGAINLVAVAVLAPLTVSGFASLWCGWAAVTSAAIALHIRYGGPHQTVAEAVAV